MSRKNRVILNFIIIVVSFVFYPAEYAGGSDWIIIDAKRGGEGDNYCFYYIDKENIINSSKSIFRYRGMTVLVPKKGPLPSEDDLKNKFGLSGDDVELDCNEKKTRPAAPEKGLPVYESNAWSYIEPDSVDEKIYKLLCGK